MAAAKPTVVAAAAAAPAAATEVVAAAGADGSASTDVVEACLPTTGLAGVRPSGGGDEARVETPLAAGRTSSGAGSITLVSSGVDTAGIGSATPIGAERLAASTAGVDDASAAGWADGNATGAVTLASPADALDAVDLSPSVSCFTSTAFPTVIVDFASATSDNATVEDAVRCVKTSGVAAAVAEASTAAFAWGAGADFFEVPEARAAADG